MTPLLTVPLVAACLLGAGWSALAAARDRRPSNLLLLELLVLVALTVAQFLVAVVQVARGNGPDETATFLLYAGFEVLVVPVGAVWSSAEKSRSSTLVITMACATVAVMTLRMLAIWSATHA